MSTVLWSLSLTATIWTLKDDNIHFFWQMCKYINEEYHFFLETNPLIFIPLAVSKVEHISSFKLFKHLYLYYTFSKKIYVCNHVSIQINHKKFFVLREKHHCQNSQSFRINYTIFDTPYSTRYSEFFIIHNPHTLGLDYNIYPSLGTFAEKNIEIMISKNFSSEQFIFFQWGL